MIPHLTALRIGLLVYAACVAVVTVWVNLRGIRR